MERSEWGLWFFFVRACQGVKRLTALIERRFAALFDDAGESKPETLGKHFYDIIRERQEERFCTNIDVANAAGITLTELKVSYYQYYLIIEKLNTSKTTEPQQNEYE